MSENERTKVEISLPPRHESIPEEEYNEMVEHIQAMFAESEGFYILINRNVDNPKDGEGEGALGSMTWRMTASAIASGWAATVIDHPAIVPMLFSSVEQIKRSRSRGRGFLDRVLGRKGKDDGSFSVV